MILYYKHREEDSLKHENGFVYINGYEKNTIQIIQQIRSLTSSGLGGYVESFEQWMQETGYKIDSEEKDKALRKLFASSKVALIYGSAGTGKSTMVKHISNFFSNRKKIYLTNTHSAKENLKRYVNMTENNTFSTIKYYADRYVTRRARACRSRNHRRAAGRACRDAFDFHGGFAGKTRSVFGKYETGEIYRRGSGRIS